MKINDQPGEFRGPAEVRFVRVLPGPIERVWEFLTDPEKRARWIGGGSTEPRVGGKMRFEFLHKNLAPNETPPPQFRESHEEGNVMECVVTRWEPPHVLAYTFGSDGESVVTFELSEQGRNVLLVLTHRATDGDLPYMSSFGAGWHTHLALMISILEEVSPAPFWPRFVERMEFYEKARLAAGKA